MEFASRLKIFITENWEAIGEFVFDVRISQSMIYKYINSESSPSGEVLKKLYDVGCNINWLLSGHGEMWNDTEAGRTLRQKHESELLVQTETGIDKKKKK